ncbi:MAG TPA: NADH:ubiquinone reductase (Na(+)-transporting) subunit C [Bacteroidales bacterium]|nr:NADH:ubiquinone reductase (Na(+)-transporting) subunit C [Bacteroidales bacterium]HRZ48731.1 NADH:ubiquinone reductase (Na(+)-transporting) subunit C [Bacteroidales bacterium]
MAKSFSNQYIFTFAFVMVVIVATGLSLGFSVLKPYQDENRRIEKIQYILKAAGIPSEKKEATRVYSDHLIAEWILDPVTGEPVSVYQSDGTYLKGDRRAFDIDMKKLLAARKAFNEGKSKDNPGIPLFVMRSDKGDTLYVIPVWGRGLWGPVWGNIAFGTDRNSITGATFDHQGETPGLGAEINKDFFSDQFKGKKLMGPDDTFQSVKVIKGGVKNLPAEKQPYNVDGISGGTITSDGVSNMLLDCIRYYEPFMKKAR